MNARKEITIFVKSQHIASTLLEAMNAYAHKATSEMARRIIRVFLILIVLIVANINCW